MQSRMHAQADEVCHRNGGPAADPLPSMHSHGPLQLSTGTASRLLSFFTLYQTRYWAGQTSIFEGAGAVTGAW